MLNHQNVHKNYLKYLEHGHSGDLLKVKLYLSLLRPKQKLKVVLKLIIKKIEAEAEVEAESADTNEGSEEE